MVAGGGVAGGMAERGGRWPLTGRGEELARVRDHLAERTSVLLAGPAGVGKSRFLAELAEWHRAEGFEVLEITGVESVGASPWSAVVDVTRATGSDLATRVVTQLSRRRDERLLIIADDAQLFDDVSAAALHRTIRSGAATVAIGLRTGERAPAPVTALWKDDLVRRVDLAPLDRGATDELAQAVLGRLGVRQLNWLWDRCQGHPLFLRELIAGLDDAGQLQVTENGTEFDTGSRAPTRLVELVQDHLDRLGAPAIELLAALSLCQPLEKRLTNQLVGRALVDDLIRNDLVAELDEQISVAHPLYGEAALSTITPEALDGLRKRLADLLNDVAGRRRQAAILLLDAGVAPSAQVVAAGMNEAIDRFQPDMVTRLAAALEPSQHSTASACDAAIAHAMLGDPATSERYFDLAVSLADDDEVSALWVTRVATAFDYSADPSAAMALATQALEYVTGGDEQVLRAQLLRPRLFVEPLEPVFQELVRLADGSDLDPRAAVTVPLDAATSGWHLLHLDQSTRLIQQALIATGDDVTNNSRARQVEVMLAMWRDGIDAASELAEQHLAEARHRGSGEALLLAAVACVFAPSRGGDAPATLRIIDEFLRVGDNATHLRHQPLTIAEHALALSAVPGREREAAAQIALYRELPPPAQIVGESIIGLAASRLARRSGTIDRADELLGAAIEAARWRNARAHEVQCLRERAWTAGSGPEDLAAFDAIAETAGAGLALIFRDEARALAADDPAGLQAAAEAASAHRAHVIAAEAARAAQVRWTERGELARAFACELMVESELAAGPTDPSWTPLHFVDADPVLSSREREVVDLVVAGATNAAAAEQLFISAHTVKGHLERIYAKLGVRSRDALRAFYESG